MVFIIIQLANECAISHLDQPKKRQYMRAYTYSNNYSHTLHVRLCALNKRVIEIN